MPLHAAMTGQGVLTDTCKPGHRSYDTVEVVRLDEKLFKFLYAEGEFGLH